MAATNTVLVNGELLGLTAVSLYQSPVNGLGTRVIAMTLTNDNAAPQTYDLHIVPDSGKLNIFLLFG